MVRFVPEGDGFKLRREHPDETMHERFVPFRDPSLNMIPSSGFTRRFNA